MDELIKFWARSGL